jgi:TonB-linked SusC/RagA family outer membrane protein
MKKYILSLFLILWCGALIYGQTVTGVVTDAKDGLPLAGSSIVIKGTFTGTSTGADGRYTLKASGNSVLVFSFTGYISQEIAVQNRTSIDVQLMASEKVVDEVVIVGYGTQKKVTLTGSVASVNVGELKQSSTANLSNSLAGRLTGLVAQQLSGKPGSDASSILIRGRATTNTQTPLILVDGVERDYTQVDPNDIESISILKDASSTAVYGVRGANGVLLITTKRGSSTGNKFTFTTQQSIQQNTRLNEYLNSYDFATLYNEACRNDRKPERYTATDLEHYRLHDSPYTHPDIDWLDMFLKPYSFQSTYNLNMRGGTEFLKYFVSASFLDQNGIYKYTNDNAYGTSTDARFKRFNLRANLDIQLTKTTLLSFDINGRNEDRYGPGNDANVYQALVQTPPNAFPIFQENGMFGARGESNYDKRNPMAEITKSGYRRGVTNVYDATMKVNQKLDFITKGLSFNGIFANNSSFGFARTTTETASLWKLNTDGTYSRVVAEVPLAVANARGPQNRLIQYELSLNYNKSFGRHTITSLVNYNERRQFSAQNLPDGYRGLVGRVTYNYAQKYLAEFNAGYNGSNQFQKGKRYGFFPALSLGWNLAEEGFVKNNAPWISSLKLRGSYGIVGNDRIGGYSYLYVDKFASSTGSVWNQPNNDYYFGTIAISSAIIKESSIGNNNVTWERAKKQNYGVDGSLFRSRLSFSLDYFIENRVDILSTPGNVSIFEGITGLPPGNYGKVRNKGYEIEANYRSNPERDLSFSFGGNFSFARNKILEIAETQQKYKYQMATGHAIGVTNIYTVLGYFKDSTDIAKSPPQKIGGTVRPGDFKYKDINGDGIVDSYDAYPSKYSTVPEIMFAINAGVNYKNFDIRAIFQGAAHAMVWTVAEGFWEFYNGSKVSKTHLGRWTPETAETATYPRLTLVSDGDNNHQRNTYHYKSTDYLRLKNLEIGYSFSRSALKYVHVDALRIYFTGINLFTWDKMKILDPEQGQQSYGSTYPQQKLYTLGLSITF